MKQGYIQIYTGEGKGKTTAALGLAMRAVGRGYKVAMYQFLKGTHSGELVSAQRLAPELQIFRFAVTDKFFWRLNEEEKIEIQKSIKQAYEKVLSNVKDCTYDVVILDEVMGAIKNELLTVNEVCRLLDEKAEGVELVLTGRNVPREVLERADLVTEMKKIKHYIDKGVYAREGIEK